MKRFVIIFISLIVGYALYWCISDYDYRYNKINSIVGIYKLDFNHTDSEIYKDSIEKYNNLRLIFNSDMTFSLSFSVPFMADTVGTWKVGGMNEWNEIVYHNGIIDQFGKFDDGDTIIYINSPTPQKTYKKPTLIDKVFFVRIKYFFKTRSPILSSVYVDNPCVNKKQGHFNGIKQAFLIQR